MLSVLDTLDQSNHSFSLNTVNTSGSQYSFTLISDSYDGLEIMFTLESQKQKLPIGYTVTVHLFKSPFHKQTQILDIRSADRAHGNGKIGYMFNLEALFTPGALQLDEHRYCYAYFGLEYIFYHIETLQTKVPEIKSDPYAITDFFDDDTIILVLCDQYCSEIAHFNIYNYLPNLFGYGLTLFTKETPIQVINNNAYLLNKYDSIVTSHNAAVLNGVFPLRMEKAKLKICSEAYVIHLFTNLMQQKIDRVTRFLMLYQVVEVFMPKMIHLEAQQRICRDINSLTTDKLKELVSILTKHNELITALLTRHAIPDAILTVILRQEILDFFIHVNHPEYLDPIKNSNLTMVDLFYDFRNKIVHEYRILHISGINQVITIEKIDNINQLTEVLIGEAIVNFVG